MQPTIKTLQHFWNTEDTRTRPLLIMGGFLLELAGAGILVLAAGIWFNGKAIYGGGEIHQVTAMMTAMALLVGGTLFWLGLTTLNAARRSKENISHGLAIALLVGALLIYFGAVQLLQFFAAGIEGANPAPNHPAVIELIEKYRAEKG